MKIVILSPAVDIVLDDALKKRIAAAGELVVVVEPTAFTNVLALQDPDDKIVAIDPDFCGWKVTRGDLERMKNVRAICLQTTSFGWIDTEAAKELGIAVLNLKGFSTLAVAEWAIMMTFNVARRIPIIIKDGWKIDFTHHQGIELKGRTAGIIGLGNIGTRVAEICAGLGMHVIYWSRNAQDNRFSAAKLPSLMKEADVIFLTLAQNKDTETLITDDLLRSMKKTTIFTSVVHKIYNHELVVEMVGKNDLYGYAFESGEKKIADYKGNIWAGPELAWCTSNSMQRNGEMWTESIERAAQGEYPSQVNK